MSQPNPYHPPPAEAEPEPVGRPWGVTVMAVLTGIGGLLLLALYIFLLAHWAENNDALRRQRMPPSVFWGMVGATVPLALVCAVGMWRGAKWSWWIACSMLVLDVVGAFGRAAAANFSHGNPSLETLLSQESLRGLVYGTVLALLLKYWLSMRVRRYFETQNTGPLKAALLSGGIGIGVVSLFTVLLLIFERLGSGR